MSDPFSRPIQARHAAHRPVMPWRREPATVITIITVGFLGLVTLAGVVFAVASS